MLYEGVNAKVRGGRQAISRGWTRGGASTAENFVA